jgi:hypothetical protein
MFTVRICFGHLVFDRWGAAQFLKVVAKMARGLLAPSVPSVLDPDAIYMLLPPVPLRRLARNRGEDGDEGILDFLTGQVYVSCDLTIKNGWSYHRMMQRAKKFRSMAHKCELYF